MMRSPRPNVRARSPSEQPLAHRSRTQAKSVKHTIFSKQILEVFPVKIVRAPIPSNRHEESNQEEYHTQQYKRNGILERSPEPLPKRLRALLRRNLIILLIQEVRKRHNHQTQHRIQRVQRVVHNLQRIHNIIHLLLRRPILAHTMLRGRRRRDERDIDGQQQHGGQQRRDGEYADYSYGCRSLARRLVDVDEN